MAYIARKHFQRWTQAEKDTLREMVIKKKGSGQIAKELGRTRSSVMAMKSTMDLGVRITKRHGSGIPMTLTAHSKKTETPAQPDLFTKAPESKVEKPVNDAPKIKSLGQTLDSLLFKAKMNGMKVTVTFSNDHE